MGMGDLDRRKHDVDIIERVLGGIRDSDASGHRTHVVDVDVDVPSSRGSSHSTLEVTVGIDEDESDHRRPMG
jgi:hypothetical protein